jgi:hypothetical protein
MYGCGHNENCWGYTEEVELKMQRLFERLTEKDRRCYAAIEATKLSHGGIESVSKLFKIDPKTVSRRVRLARRPCAQSGQKKRGGCKNLTERVATLEANFLSLLAEFTAGDPMREGVLWTNLSRCEISRRLAEMGESC